LTQILVTSSTDVGASRREAASLRLQISSALKVVQQSLGEEHTSTLALAEALASIKGIEAELKSRAAMDSISEA
jgi:hypothetical protein